MSILDRPPSVCWRISVLIGGCVTVVAWTATRNPIILWTGGIILVLAALAQDLGVDPQGSKATIRHATEYALVGLGAMCVVLTLCAHRPDIDDAGYLSISVAACDNPDDQLLVRDTIHGLPSLTPLLYPIRVQSLELLVGSLAYITGYHALDFAHVLIPALAAFLVVPAYARLFRLLMPNRWIWAVVPAILFLVIIGNTHRAYGNFAFVRLHQGKAIFLTALVPLIAAYGLELAFDPGRRQWLRLAAAQVAAVGATSTALWVAPTVAALAVLCGLNRHHHPVRTLFLGLSASTYVVLIGSWISIQIRSGVESSTLETNADLMAASLRAVLGEGPVVVLAFLGIITVLAFGRSVTERRFAGLYFLGLLILWNPFLSRWIAENLTHPLTYWRVFWVLPLPALMAIAVTAPIGARWIPMTSRPYRGLFILAIAAILFYLVRGVCTLSPENGVRLGTPTWKVPGDAFEAAYRLSRQASAGQTVLAPIDVAPWITTLHSHPQPLVVRPHYLHLLVRDQIGTAEVNRRLTLARLVSGQATCREEIQMLREAVAGYPLAAVCLASGATVPEIRQTLAEVGLKLVDQDANFDIWATPGRTGTSSPRRALFWAESAQ